MHVFFFRKDPTFSTFSARAKEHPAERTCQPLNSPSAHARPCTLPLHLRYSSQSVPGVKLRMQSAEAEAQGEIEYEQSESDYAAECSKKPANRRSNMLRPDKTIARQRVNAAKVPGR